MDFFEIMLQQKLAGGGGGASNVVQGTFTTGATRGSTETITIPYDGNGYPIALLIYVDGGVYNNGTGGNLDWYNSVNRYDIGFYSMVKARMTTAPTYTASDIDNSGTVEIIYKSSTSSPTSYTHNSTVSAIVYSSSEAFSATNCARFKGDGKTLNYYIGNLNSGVGFAPSTKFAYIAVYSE